MWVDAVVQIGAEAIALSVERLDDDARERTAISIAWLTVQALKSPTVEELAAWHAMMEAIVRQHVLFSVSDDRIENPNPAWWREAIGRAIVRFVKMNDLGPTINRHLQALAEIDRAEQPAS
jgi:hypothetical protein